MLNYSFNHHDKMIQCNTCLQKWTKKHEHLAVSYWKPARLHNHCLKTKFLYWIALDHTGVHDIMSTPCILVTKSHRCLTVSCFDCIGILWILGAIALVCLHWWHGGKAIFWTTLSVSQHKQGSSWSIWEDLKHFSSRQILIGLPQTSMALCQNY